MTVFAPSHELTELDPTKRVRYSLGMIVGDDELRQDQRYLTARDDRHQRALHGWGVVSGLELVLEDAGHLEVHPGAAIDGVGRWICIDVTQCADLLPWLAEQEGLPAMPATVPVWVSLCYDECATDLIPVPSGPCRTLDDSVQPSRVKDSFRLGLSLEKPPVRGDLAEFPETDVMVALLDEDAEIGDKRAELSKFVTSRGDPGGFVNRCLDPLEPACVLLGKVEVPLVADGDTVAFGEYSDQSWVTFDDRPLVLSTQFLQEWLLRVEGGGTVVVQPDPDPEPVPFPLDELTDVSAPTAREGNVVVGVVAPGDVGTGVGTDAPPPNARWEERRLELNLLTDVQIPSNFGSSPSDAGLVLKFDGNVWRPQTDLFGDLGPGREKEPHVLCRPMPYAIVAGGVVELEFNEDGFLEDNATSVQLTTRYGELEAKRIQAQALGALLLLRFRGYDEAWARFRKLAGRQFVVKLTGESDAGLVRTHVVRINDDGIVVFVGRPRNDDADDFRKMVIDELGGDPSVTALHVEISAFDDPQAENFTVSKVPQLTEDV
jgi:hypothetical protein